MGTSRKRQLRRWLILVFVLAGVCVAGVVVLRKTLRRAPVIAVAIPNVNVDGLDPEIVSTIERARSATKLAPRSAAAWGTLGSVLMVHKFHKEALPCFAEAERLQPNEPRWPYLEGVVLLSWDPDAAIPKLERGAELAGIETAAPRLRLAHLLIERGKLAQAESHLRIVAQRYPDDPHGLLGLAKLEVARGHLEDALKYLEKSAAQPQTQRASAALIANVQQRLGNSEAAEAASKRVASLPTDPPLPDPYVDATGVLQSGLQTWLMRADRLLKTGRIADSLALFEKAVTTYPDAAIAWQLLGQARIETKEYPKAEVALQRAVQLAPDSAESYFQLATAFFLQNRADDAITAFRRSVSLRPTYAPGYYNLGIALSGASKRGEAIDAFREAVRLAPDFADAHRWLGATLALEQRYAESLEPLRRALELNPSDQAAARMLERAELRSKEGVR
jgi:tetratricopeptide (TPR) repeat protein